jgi:CBS domain-containing protein
MRAGELCVRDVVTAQPDETVVDAARRMAMLRVGDLVVVESRDNALPRPVGIVTDRDLIIEVLARPERVPATTRLAEVMRRPLVTASEDDDIETIVDRMRDNGVRRIPIIDDDGGLQGVLSIDDVIGWIREEIQIATKLLEHQGRGPQLRTAR